LSISIYAVPANRQKIHVTIIVDNLKAKKLSITVSILK